MLRTSHIPEPRPEPVRSWSAARLPKLRDQTVAALANPDSFVHVLMQGKSHRFGADVAPMSGPYGISDEGANPEHLSTLAQDLTDAALYWVTSPMAALAVSSAETLDEVRWCPSDQPVGSGLLVWDHGISGADFDQIRVPVTAVSWHRHCDAGLAICLYMARHQLADMMEGQSLRAAARGRWPTASALTDALNDVPPLLPVWSTEVATTTEWTPVMPSMPFATILSSLYSTWVLMMQPGIADQTPQPVEPRVRKAIARTGKRVPDVTLIELRRRYMPRDHGDAPSPGRNYRVQWVVDGHWRNQAHGPGRADRKKIWIAPFTKGPEGAPMAATKKVHVWRR